MVSLATPPTIFRLEYFTVSSYGSVPTKVISAEENPPQPLTPLHISPKHLHDSMHCPRNLNNPQLSLLLATFPVVICPLVTWTALTTLILFRSLPLRSLVLNISSFITPRASPFVPSLPQRPTLVNFSPILQDSIACPRGLH